MAVVPEKPSLAGLEAKWDARWRDQGTYRFDRSKTREEIYVIDTPPPTISGLLHLGTAFGYIQVDAIARFQRMRGREVFYPMGWDDNGLPTERRVQNHYGVRCVPSVPYDPDLVLSEGEKAREHRPISRPNFVELCQRLTRELEHDFERQWRCMGLSVDWSLTYATVDARSRRVAQRAFVRNVGRGEAYARDAPTMWDVDFQTAVAQAEMEDRTVQGRYYRLSFVRVDGGVAVEIDTTRPELLPCCVALVAHPDDDRYRALVGTTVITPVFGVEVPVLVHHLAEPDKGSGIAMVCTFGDTTDVVWWRELDLPTRSVMGRDGRFQQQTPDWLSGAGAEVWARLAGKSPNQARRLVIELLKESGHLIGDPKPVAHEVKFYEKGERPLEIVTSRQWYIRNGARNAELRETLVRRGGELVWHPGFMRLRYEHWVGGLNTDWLVSRQRYFGVPFPVWYSLDNTGEALWEEPILADEDTLPVDPQTDVPAGYDECQRGKPHGFIGDPDVMDTWATSSLTPQIAGGWEDDEDLFSRVFPTDLRPQGPEIIRTWLFSTLLRSELEHKTLPWKHAMINGWILDPDRKKMSKSQGNVLTPMPLVNTYGADGFRYWSCKSGPGTDTAADQTQMKVGRRLAVKILNAGKLVLGLRSRNGITSPLKMTSSQVAGLIMSPSGLLISFQPLSRQDETLADVTQALDRALLAQLATAVEDATAAFDGYAYHRALELTESFFWRFCDDYVELVKQRAYDQGSTARSAHAALYIAVSILLRMFAPFLPFVTEEVWSWWKMESLHRASWPCADELREAVNEADPRVLDTISTVLTDIRRAQSEHRRSQPSEVVRLIVEDNAGQLARLR
ncbi:MAG: valine--tRNA ligase, partial [Pseudonocardiales bacterium]|nr:valine--tRNA ligase [Pseudonocardiales bacterium]